MNMTQLIVNDNYPGFINPSDRGNSLQAISDVKSKRDMIHHVQEVDLFHE